MTRTLKKNTPVPELLEYLQSEDTDLREEALKHLRRHGSGVLEIPLKNLRDENRIMRSSSVWTLGMLGLPDAVEPLCSALDDPEIDVRTNIVWALGQIRDARAVPHLLGIVLDDPVEDVRQGAAYALGQIGASGAVDNLIQALRDPSWIVRETTAEALAQIGSPEAIPALEDALTDENPRVRKASAEALRRLE